MSDSSIPFGVSQSARHRVRNGVELMILRGEVESGTRLKQISLAEQFGVAQGVVREALIDLQSMGLVELVDNRGIYVSQINGKRLIDSIEVRAAIEGAAVRLCCDRCSRNDQRELRRLAHEIYDLCRSGLVQKGAILDRQFHHELVRLSGNGELLRVTRNYRAFGKIVQLNRNTKSVYEEHAGIVDAIESGDADEAERRTRHHLEAAKTLLEEKLRADPEYVPRWVL